MFLFVVCFVTTLFSYGIICMIGRLTFMRFKFIREPVEKLKWKIKVAYWNWRKRRLNKRKGLDDKDDDQWN